VAFNPGFRTVKKDGFTVMAHAVQAMVVNMDFNSIESAARNLGTVVRASEARFNSQTLRPGEVGVGSGGRRETGNFTFGTLARGSFTGTQFEDKDTHTFGFGFPDIAKADQRTNFVWRSLEFGLAGTEVNSMGVLHGPGFSRFPENQHLVPQGTHIMPRRFMFTEASPRSSFLFLNNQVPERIPRGGAGFEGKHFIEDGFLDSIEIMAGRYKKAVLDAVASFGKS